MKTTDAFKASIQAFLEGWAMEAEPNLEAYTSKDKSINDCSTYILNQVKKSGVHGFADADIFAMAVEYYTTKGIAIGAEAPKGSVVVNHTIELTDDEKAKAKEKAMDDLIKETKTKARKKPTTKAKAPLTSVEKAGKAQAEAKEKAKPKAEPTVHPTLF